MNDSNVEPLPSFFRRLAQRAFGEEELSKKFEYHCGALDYMRKACFVPSRGEDPFAHFLRQIEHWTEVEISSD